MNGYRKPATMRAALLLLWALTGGCLVMIFLDSGYEVPLALGYLIAALLAMFSALLMARGRGWARILPALAAGGVVWALIANDVAQLPDWAGRHPGVLTTFLLIVATAILGYLPPSNRWFRERRDARGASAPVDAKLAERIASKYRPTP